MKNIFQLQGYRVLTHQDELIRAVIDPRMIDLFRRVMRGKHDCAICQTTLDLDPGSNSSPGFVGYLHGDVVDAVCVAACVACTLKLGDVETSRMISQMFVDEVCGGGTVEMVQAGTA